MRVDRPHALVFAAVSARVGIVALMGAVALPGCANGRSNMEPRVDAAIEGELDTGTTEFPDAAIVALDAPFDAPGIDAASVDAPIPDAFRPMPDAYVVGPPDAFVPPVDARVPDAAGSCTEGSRVACATSCMTTGSALCSGGMLGACEPPAERCNGADDDCDGTRDDGFECSLGESGACTTSCGSTGSRTCSGSCGWGACTPPSVEVCNGRDEDCDGQTDESFRARYGFTTYTELSGRHAGCNGATQRWGLDCNAAIHRYCGDGCTTSGFGPIENSGDVANVACVVGEVRTVGYAELAGHQPPCDGVGERMGPNCNAAIHRYCGAQGFVSGFGPVENSGASASITCVRGAEVRATTYTELSGHLAPCDGVTERIGTACNAAISRYCSAAGFTSGFGPVENSGDVAYVACVRP